MKKSLIIYAICMLGCLWGISQNSPVNYPVPDYGNEIYLQKNDSSISLMRLEKGSSKQEMKVKVMGMGGMDQGYELEGEKSTVQLMDGNNLVFIFYTGEGAGKQSAENDSIMRANGMDPSMMNNPMASLMDPSQNISLYNMKSEKGKRKIMLQSMGVMGKSKKTATKFTLSIKKVKEGFYELLVDKTLPKGEYAFVMASFSMDQSFSLFAFSVN